MTDRMIPEIFQETDELERHISDLAVQLYRGQGGAGEIARLIGEQAKLMARRRAEAARKRAVAA